MKNYSSNRAQKGKTAYRTPSRWIKNHSKQLKQSFSHVNKDTNHYYASKKFI